MAQVMSLSHHPHVHVHVYVSVSLRFALPFDFPHFLPHSFHFLLHLKFVDNLRTPPKESMDLSDEFSSQQVMSPAPTTSRRPQSSPARSSWTRRRSSPTKSLLRTPTTLHSRVCFAKVTEYIAITLYEKTCLSVRRRRQCPIERGNPVSTKAQKHRLGLYLMSKNRKFLQSAKQELTDTNCKLLTTEEAY